MKRDVAGFMDSFKEKLNEIRKAIDEDRYRKRVLMLCQQAEPRSFDEYSSSGSFRKLEKFESSTYSEVLKAVDLADNNKPVVMKIMRALSKGVIKKMPSIATKGCQSYNDILNELVVTQALSQLHDGVILNGKPNALYKTHFFCLIHEIRVVSGNLERTLSKSQAVSTGNLPMSNEDKQQATSNLNKAADDKNKLYIKDDELNNLSEDDRMLMEALPYEYVVSVMRHDGQPLWWMMTHKKLTAEQLTSVLVQVIVGIAIAEKVYLYEHRDLHVSNILIKKTSKSMIPFVLDGNRYSIISRGVKATIIDATFSRLTHNGKIYHRDLTSTLHAYGSKKTPTRMSLQNRSYRQMVHITNNNWEDFTPKTNLIWLTYLCETLMKSEIMKSNSKLVVEIKKIRDYTLKVNNTLELLGYFPFDKEKKTSVTDGSKHSTVTSKNGRANNNKHVTKSTNIKDKKVVQMIVTKDPSQAKALMNDQHQLHQLHCNTIDPTTQLSSLNSSMVSHFSQASDISGLNRVSTNDNHHNIHNNNKDKRAKLVPRSIISDKK